jgi:hypothetical protein
MTQNIMQERIAALLRTPEPFKAWLEGKQPDERVGLARCSGADPVTTFLQDETGLEGLDVTSLYVALPMRAHEKQRPKVQCERWLIRFIMISDRGAKLRTPRTARQCLDFVAEAERD